MPAFRFPAGFFLSRHPFAFLEWSFCDFGFQDEPEFAALAGVAVAPDKNIRPAISAMITLDILDIIIGLLKPGLGGESFSRGVLPPPVLL